MSNDSEHPLASITDPQSAEQSGSGPAQMTNVWEHPAARRTPVPHKRLRHPCQRAYGTLRRRILETLTRPRRNRIANGLQRSALAGFLIPDLILRWLMGLCDTVGGNRGYFAVASVLAAYLAAFGLIATKSSQEETGASVERSSFTSVIGSGNAASFVIGMKVFGPTQMMPATEHPSLLKFWQWGRVHYPNQMSMWRWAIARFDECRRTVVKPTDCGGTVNAWIDLTDDDLGRADLHKTDLSGANLSLADLSGADLYKANLSSAALIGAVLHNANLSSADLKGADLNHADMNGADLNNANLSSADLSYTELRNANLSSADLTGADLSGADLTGLKVIQAQLDKTCGANVTLDPGLKIKPCQEHR